MVQVTWQFRAPSPLCRKSPPSTRKRMCPLLLTDVLKIIRMRELYFFKKWKMRSLIGNDFTVSTLQKSLGSDTASKEWTGWTLWYRGPELHIEKQVERNFICRVGSLICLAFFSDYIVSSLFPFAHSSGRIKLSTCWWRSLKLFIFNCKCHASGGMTLTGLLCYRQVT